MNRRGRILVAVDLSENSRAIVEHACKIAADASAELHLVHVNSHTGSAEAKKESRRVALEQLARLVRPTDELETQTCKAILTGQPHRSIVEYANQHSVDLIVMGTHGRTGLSHLALGSVAERVLRHASCPVQVVKNRAMEAGTMERAVEALADQYGESLQGTRANTETKMVGTLTSTLNVSNASAVALVQDLERREWATWTADQNDPGRGTWEFVTGTEFLEATGSFNPSSTNTPAVDLVIRARRLRATDIHVDPTGSGESRVRFRIDGQLEEYCRIERSVAEHLVNQWKLLAGLDASDPFRSKEGRVDFPDSARALADVEARFTSAPVAGGEAIALRLSARSDLYIPLEKLGLSAPAMLSVDAMSSAAEGLVLVSGPTGSGKTTTVYSILESICSSKRNIVSIEDPVEVPVPFVRQMSVDERHDITMTKGLKTLMRMDPDVIFLGEIRDAEAARIAMQAAASGRYVFSTLHARDIAAVFTALRDLGLADRSLAANVSGIINQRLMRRLCNACRRETDVTEAMRRKCEILHVDPPSSQFERVGCTNCRGTGYFGRVGIFEAASFSQDTQDAIANGDSESRIRSRLVEDGLTTLEVDAALKVVAGVTDYDEMTRVHWV